MRSVFTWLLLLSTPLLLGACTLRDEVAELIPGPSIEVVQTHPSKEGPSGRKWVYRLDLDFYNDSPEDAWYIIFFGAPHRIPEPSMRTLELDKLALSASTWREDPRPDRPEPRRGLDVSLFTYYSTHIHARAYHVPAGGRLSGILAAPHLAREGSSAEVWETASILLPDGRELAPVLHEQYDSPERVPKGDLDGPLSLALTPSRRWTFRLDPPRHPDGRLKGGG